LTNQHIIKALEQPLPGWEGQKIMSSFGYDTHRKPQTTSKKAAVMLLLYPDHDGILQVVYIKRPSNNPNDKHGGQISFPGGQVDPTDKDLEDTALRETYEEIGLPRKQLHILGRLSDIYVFVSDFQVSAFVGYVDHPPLFIPETAEVDFIISYPLPKLLSAARLVKDLKVNRHVLKAVPYYDLNNETLWGATAMITSEFLEVLKKSTR